MRKFLTAILTSTLLLVGSGACLAQADERLALTPIIATQKAARPGIETERLIRWLDERYEEKLQFSPTTLTLLGRKDAYGEIDDLSEAAKQGELEWLAKSVATLAEQFDYDALSASGKESYNLWVFQYEEAAAEAHFQRHAYLFGELSGWGDFLPSFMINYHQVDTVDDMQAYIERLGGLARAIDQITERARLAAADGIRPPRFAYDATVKKFQNIVSGQPFNDDADSPLWADITSKMGGLLAADAIDEETASRLRQSARSTLERQVGPAYARLVNWLEADAGNADEHPRGVAALPNGEAYYEHLLAQFTTLELSADQVHELGLAEVARIKKEMERIRAQVGFEGDLQQFFEFVRMDERFYFPNTNEGRARYITDVKMYLDQIETKLPQYFGMLPKAELIVKRVESFREVDGGSQHYQAGTPDGSRPGTYYIHMSDMGAYSITDMETTAYHEGLPGHHMQVSIAQELTGLPEFRTQSSFSVYDEGWALYTELLAKEMGQFQDPYRDFGRLTAEIWRAVRLVIDTGLHARGWTQEQAVSYFLDNSAVPEAAVRSEVRRYLTTPGQATSYKIGMIKILELRDRAMSILGEQFDIRAFHDTVLGGGAMPMPLLEARVNRWIADVSGQSM